jgi:hypothetical protein
MQITIASFPFDARARIIFVDGDKRLPSGCHCGTRSF